MAVVQFTKKAIFPTWAIRLSQVPSHYAIKQSPWARWQFIQHNYRNEIQMSDELQATVDITPVDRPSISFDRRLRGRPGSWLWRGKGEKILLLKGNELQPPGPNLARQIRKSNSEPLHKCCKWTMKCWELQLERRRHDKNWTTVSRGLQTHIT